MPVIPGPRRRSGKHSQLLDLWPPLKKVAFAFAKVCPPFHRFVNRGLINALVNAAPYRPHAWSTVSDYTSWRSLTDKTWSARSLPARHVDPHSLPDITALQEFFRRPDGKQRLSTKSTCLFPAFAQYLTDGFIRTDMPKPGGSENTRKRNTSNHEIDLCPLYGRTHAQTSALRCKSEVSGQRGRLKSQMINGEEFSPYYYLEGLTPKPEFEELDPPLGINDKTPPEYLPFIFAAGGDRVNTAPQVAMMNTLWLREHNRLAGEMERAYPSWDDERVFQTARNTVIVEFITIVVEDYINHISPESIQLLADPTVAWDAPWNKPNWITSEFSLLYRWHSLIPDTLTWNGQAYPVGNLIQNNQVLVSGSLESAFVSLSAQKTGHLGAFNTADALMFIEENSITQGRVCELATYSDYRASVSLPRPKDFSDISPDPRVVDFLKKTYRTVDAVEFYVGLFAEDTVPNSPLPELINTMVAIDAFSQALPNPLLSEQVFKEETFSKVGWESIQRTSKLEEVMQRNNYGRPNTGRISMTQADWKPQ